jgi:hypothetical protein
MLDQLTIGEKKSLDDFDASISGRRIGIPAKKSIKETFLFSSKSHDFSKMNGELYWEERELEYEFEITAATPSELEQKKTAFSNWIMNVMNEKIHDPFIPAYHFVGTFEAMEYEDDESLEKTVATVTFKAYPFKIENELSAYNGTAKYGYNTIGTVMNPSNHRIVVDFYTDRTLAVEINDAVKTMFSIGEQGVYTGFENALVLEPGENKWCASDVEPWNGYVAVESGVITNYAPDVLLTGLQNGEFRLYGGYYIDQANGDVYGQGRYYADYFTDMTIEKLVAILPGKYLADTLNNEDGTYVLRSVWKINEGNHVLVMRMKTQYFDEPSVNWAFRWHNEVL